MTGVAGTDGGGIGDRAGAGGPPAPLPPGPIRFVFASQSILVRSLTSCRIVLGIAAEHNSTIVFPVPTSLFGDLQPDCFADYLEQSGIGGYPEKSSSPEATFA